MSDTLELIQISSDENTLSLPPELCHKMYEKMVTIRRYEEAVLEVYTQGLMRGLAHLYIGQEASAVGVCSALNDDDYLTSTHRGHGHLIAKGGKVDRMMAEMMGKVDGYNRGKGGTIGSQRYCRRRYGYGYRCRALSQDAENATGGRMLFRRWGYESGRLSRISQHSIHLGFARAFCV